MIGPGVYTDLSNADYHAQTDWLSSTQLKRLLPEFYKTGGGSKDALDFGCAFHTTVLGAGEPVVPVTAASWQGKAAQEERQQAYAAGGVPILEKQLTQLDDMAAAVGSHVEASRLLTAGKPEVSVFVEVDGVPCKARFDWLADGYAVDLKTTASKPGKDLAKTVTDFGYDVSADHYLRVASAAGLDVSEFWHIWVGKDAPHYVTVSDLDSSFYDRAAVLRELALERWQHPDMTDPYPGATGRLTLSAPRWSRLD